MTEFETTVLGSTPKLKPIGSGRFDAQMVTFENSAVKGVLKFAQFTTDKTRGIPKNTMHRREVAAYRLDSEVLHFDIVPECHLVRLDGREASISEYVDGLLPGDVVPGLFDKSQPDWKVKVALLWSKVPIIEAMKVALFDLITNNTDRHGKNWLFSPDSFDIHAIDNGLCFGRHYKAYRSVIHRYLFFHQFPVPPVLLKKLTSITKNHLVSALRGYLPHKDIEETWQRLEFVISHREHLDFYSLSQGHLDKNDFPSYTRYFRPRMPNPDQLLIHSPPVSVA